ncbi:MAG: hypothetical protein GY856_15535 [bacterium]|nr:hypothetical protein [bacterium]
MGAGNKSGENIGTHSLKRVSRKRVEFKARGTALLFPSIFMVGGTGLAIGMTPGGIGGDTNMLYIGVPFGIALFLAGFLALRDWTTSRIFDLDTGYYWKGGDRPVNMQSTKEHCRLGDIHAIQLLQEYIRSSSNKLPYFSYELNLVLANGNRINVVAGFQHDRAW